METRETSKILGLRNVLRTRTCLSRGASIEAKRPSKYSATPLKENTMRTGSTLRVRGGIRRYPNSVKPRQDRRHKIPQQGGPGCSKNYASCLGNRVLVECGAASRVLFLLNMGDLRFVKCVSTHNIARYRCD